MPLRTPDHSLHQLLHAMTPQELDMLRHYLTAFGSRKEAEPMTLRLMELLLANKAPLSDSDCSRKLYGKAKDNRFEKLKSRLKQKTLDSLINDINIERNKEWDDIELVTIKLRKKLAQYYFLSLSKPNQPMIQHLLDEIILVAKKYEVFQVISEALKFKKYTLGLRKGKVVFNKINDEINLYDNAQQAVNLANDLYYQMLLIQNFTSNIEKVKYRSFLKSGLKKLNQLFLNTESSTVAYFLYLMKRNFDVLENDFVSASKTCINLIEILKNNPAIYRKQRIGSAYLFLSQCQIESNANQDSLKYAREGKRYFPAQSENYISALEIEFRALQSLNKFDASYSISVELISNSGVKFGSIREGRFNYFYACNLFQLEKYSESLKSLLTNNILTQDKSGWDIGLRTMIILTHVELGNYDLASNAVEALRKHIERRDRDKAIRPRDKVIYQVLRSLSDASFNFALTWKQEQAKIGLLQSDKPRYRWEHLGHELVRVDSWLTNKVRMR